MQSQLNDILQKQMDRKDFLKHVAIGFVALMGVSAVIKAMGGQQQAQKSAGYGASAYGGGTQKPSNSPTPVNR